MSRRMTALLHHRLETPFSMTLRALLIIAFICSIVAPHNGGATLASQDTTPQIVRQPLDLYLPSLVQEKTKRLENVLASCGNLLLIADAFQAQEASTSRHDEIVAALNAPLTQKLVYTQTTSSRL